MWYKREAVKFEEAILICCATREKNKTKEENFGLADMWSLEKKKKKNTGYTITPKKITKRTVIIGKAVGIQ